MKGLWRDVVLLFGWWKKGIQSRIPDLAYPLWIGLILLIFLFANDSALLEASRYNDESSWIHQLARGISHWGDFYTGSLIIVGLIWAIGWIRKRRSWRMAALSILAAAATAGIAVNVVRLTVGRPRPSSGLPDGLYGLHWDSGYHGFPSGHAATSMGTASAVAYCYPPVAVPALILGFSVCWSRIELNRHHWTDILAGSGLGITCGYLLAYRRRKRHPSE